MAGRTRGAGRRIWIATGLCLAILAGSAAAEDFERTFDFKGDRLEVGCLIGAMTVEAATGGEYRVVVQVHGRDASPEKITFDPTDHRLIVRFPVDEHQKYVYPALGKGSRSIFTANEGSRDNDWADRLLSLARGDRIEVRGRDFGSAVEMWADVRIQVPRDGELVARLGVGAATARGVRGHLALHTKSGGVQADDVQGELLIDTGSGSVEVSGVQGDLSVDTGSGDVRVQKVAQAENVVVDTGSGSVVVSGVAATDMLVDTGSGGVDLADIDVKSLKVDTGSGSIDARGVGADDVVFDTGSGGVDLDLDRMGRGRFHVDTGSGSIHVDVPSEVSAEFDIDTGSGGIIADLEGVDLGRRRNRHDARFTVGNGDASVTLSTGSGSVRVTQNRSGTSSRR